MLKLGCLVSGGGTVLQAILDAIDNGLQAQVVAVVSDRKNVFALERAESRGIPNIVLRPKSFSDNEQYAAVLRSYFLEHGVSLVLCCGYLSILPKAFIDFYPNRILNIHPSLIPDFCGDGFYGLKVHQAVLDAGVSETGCTVHYVNEITDGGPIIAQKRVPVRQGDTAEILQKRVFNDAERLIYPEVLERFINNGL